MSVVSGAGATVGWCRAALDARGVKPAQGHVALSAHDARTAQSSLYSALTALARDDGSQERAGPQVGL
eukprot:4599739-Prymnesium_polylepis.1